MKSHVSGDFWLHPRSQKVRQDLCEHGTEQSGLGCYSNLALKQICPLKCPGSSGFCKFLHIIGPLFGMVGGATNEQESCHADCMKEINR